MRKRLIPVLGMVLLTGCAPVASVETLLKPPRLSEEQQQIYLALQDNVGSNIALQYPRTGENLSAFTVVDLDNDQRDEALVFYEKNNAAAAENALRMSVLDQVDGRWQAMCDYPAAGTEIERVTISPFGDSGANCIFIGYSGADQSDKSLTVYTYTENDLRMLFDSPYTSFDVADAGGDEGRELLILSRMTENSPAAAAFYQLQEGAVTNTGTLSLRPGFTDFSQILYEPHKGSAYIYIDGTSGSSLMQTEIIAYGADPSFVLPDGDTVATTARPIGFLSMLTQENTVEIPVQEPFPGYAPDASEQVRLTRWLSVQDGVLTEQRRGYFSLSDGCIFYLPPAWYGTVTALRDPLTGDIVFCRYDGEIHDHMTELMRCGAALTAAEQADREADGFLLLRSKGGAGFFMRAAEPADEPLALPWTELMTHFRFL